MEQGKIYIRLLDGVIVWIPIRASQIKPDIYQILEDEEYKNYSSPSFIHEFYPGDTVTVGDYRFSDGQEHQVAKRLIKAGNWPNRKLNELKFKVTLDLLSIDKNSADNYREEIQIVCNEIEQGEFLYEPMVATVEKLAEILRQD